MTSAKGGLGFYNYLRAFRKASLARKPGRQNHKALSAGHWGEKVLPGSHPILHDHPVAFQGCCRIEGLHGLLYIVYKTSIFAVHAKKRFPCGKTLLFPARGELKTQEPSYPFVVLFLCSYFQTDKFLAHAIPRLALLISGTGRQKSDSPPYASLFVSRKAIQARPCTDKCHA